MTSFNGENFLKLLQTFHYNTKELSPAQFDCFFETEDVSTFMIWMCNSFGPENVIKEEELEEYELWASMNAETLENDDENYREFDSDYSEYNDSSHEIEELQEEINVSKNLISILDKHNSTLRGELLVHQRRKRDLENQQMEVFETLETIQRQCARMSEYYDASNIELLKNISTLAHIGTTHHELQNCFTSPSNILPEELLKNCTDLISVTIQNYSDRRTSQYLANPFSRENTLEKLSLRLGFWEKKMNEAILECISEQIEMHELETLIERLVDLSREVQEGKSTKCNERQNCAAELELQLQHLIENELLPGVRLFCRVDIVNAVMHEKKLVRDERQCNLSHLEWLKCHLDAQLQLNDLLFWMLTRERFLMEDVTQLWKGFYLPLGERINDLMQRANAEAVGQPMKRRSDLLSRNKALNLLELRIVKKSNIFSSSLNLHSNVLKDELCRESICSLGETLNLIETRKKSVRELEKYVICGPTKKAVIVNYHIYSQLIELNGAFINLYKILQKELAAITEAQTNASKPPLAHKRLLWVQFLVDCAKFKTLFNMIKPS